MRISLTDSEILRLYRQAKIALLEERSGIPDRAILHFEANLPTSVDSLRAALTRGTNPIDESLLVVRHHSKKNLELRAHIQQGIQSAALDLLWLRSFGPLLDSLCTSGCYSNRLKTYTHKLNYEHINPSQRYLFSPWINDYERFHEDIRKTIRLSLERGRGCTLFSFDLRNYYNSLDLQFLTQDGFLAELTTLAARTNIPFNSTEYVERTQQLSARYRRFQSLVAKRYRCRRNLAALPIGAIAARTIANVALFRIDERASTLGNQPGPNRLLHYARWVDDIVLVVDGQVSGDGSEIFRKIAPFRKDGTLDNDQLLLPNSNIQLNSRKARKFEFIGDAGAELLTSLSSELDAVGSYRGAFGAAISKTVQREQLLELVRDTATSNQHLQYIESTKIRRGAAATLLKKVLEASVLDVESIGGSRNAALSALSTILKKERDWPSFVDISLRGLGTAVVARDTDSAHKFKQQLIQRQASVRSHLGPASLDGSRCAKEATLVAADHLENLVSKVERMSASPTRDSRGLRPQLIAQYQRADIRLLNFEDDQRWAPRSASPEQLPVADADLTLELKEIGRYVKACMSIGDDSYVGLSPIRIWLSHRPPSLIDVSLKWAQAYPHSPIPTQQLVNAVRGTRFYDVPAYVKKNKKGRRIEPRLGLDSRPFVRIALANLKTTSDAFEAAVNGKPDRTLKRLEALSEIVDAARRLRHPKEHLLLVLPELSVPRHALRELASALARENIGLVAGLEYWRKGATVANEVVAVIPRKYGVVAAIWRKTNPAAGDELNGLKARQLCLSRPVDPPGSMVLESQYGTIGVLICSELLELPARTRLVGRIDLLLVPSWNVDTPTFDALVSSSSLDIHCFVGVANNAAYSDCRLRAPAKKAHQRDLCRIIERSNSVVSARIDVQELRSFQQDELRKRLSANVHPSNVQPAADPEPPFKPLPPGFEFSRGSGFGRAKIRRRKRP